MPLKYPIDILIFSDREWSILFIYGILLRILPTLILTQSITYMALKWMETDGLYQYNSEAKNQITLKLRASAGKTTFSLEDIITK